MPFQLLRQEVDARITAKTVEIFHRGKLVAVPSKLIGQTAAEFLVNRIGQIDAGKRRPAASGIQYS